MTQTAEELLPLTPFEVLADSNHDVEHWLKMRMEGIGASEIAVVLGMAPASWGSVLALYAKKIGVWKETKEEGEYIFWGRHLEASIISGYHKRTGRAVVTFGLLLRSVKFPWLLATPDALTTDDPKAIANAQALNRCINAMRRMIRHQKNLPPELVLEFGKLSEGWWGLQVKNIGFRSAADWVDGAPDYYRVQCMQESLLLGGSTRCTAAALVAGQRLVWEDIERDEITERRMVNLGHKFWTNHVEARVEPAADGTEQSERALKYLHPFATPESVLQLPEVMMAKAYARDTLEAQGKVIDEQLKEIDNTLKQALGDFERCHFPDGSGFTYKTTNYREKTVYTPAGSYRKLLRTFPKADAPPKRPKKKGKALDELKPANDQEIPQ